MYQVEEGTVIHGTHRSEDLIPTFLGILELMDKSAHDSLVENYPEYTAYLAAIESDDEESEANNFMDSEIASEMVNDLFDRINEFTPEGMEFGAHPGDGADFGFWSCEEDEDSE